MNDTSVNEVRKEIVNPQPSDSEQFNFMIQLLVEGYLKRKGQMSMSEALKQEGLEDKPGVIYGYHIEFVQMLMIEELNTLGIDLIGEVKKTGAEYVLGKLSDIEKKYLTNKINNMSGVINVVIERQKNKAKQ